MEGLLATACPAAQQIDGIMAVTSGGGRHKTPRVSHLPALVVNFHSLRATPRFLDRLPVNVVATKHHTDPFDTVAWSVGGGVEAFLAAAMEFFGSTQVKYTPKPVEQRASMKLKEVALAKMRDLRRKSRIKSGAMAEVGANE